MNKLNITPIHNFNVKGTNMDDEGEVVTDEKRRSNVLKLRKLVWDIKANQAKRHKSLVWKQYHDPEELLRALGTFRDDD